MKLDIKAYAWILFAVIAYITFSAYVDISKQWESKIKNQRQNNYQVTTSQNHWEELALFREDWEKFFTVEGDASASRHELFKQLKLNQIGLEPTQSKIVKSDTSVVVHEGKQIGLSKTCVKNMPSGFGFKGTSVSQLLASLNSLHKRKSVAFGDLKLINKNGKAEVSIDDLCVYMRISEVSA
ncbi:hypothetical protein PULV_a4028 [Pseudoalteromonas ulvae UL12]|uniref:hypothetical protein n=1 Tax=Pseudoalteromonas ulvae TaxID=107327 RepID=UPI00186BA25A|nr:hypothetical protein [Pseudoalteromonas ulvae]MBE0362215.1 hypothetical protein [Pseudoalteromonas ulvae UL12]